MPDLLYTQSTIDNAAKHPTTHRPYCEAAHKMPHYKISYEKPHNEILEYNSTKYAKILAKTLP